MRYLLPILLLSACEQLDQLKQVEKNCEDRTAFYEDTDGDGFGDPSSVYIGCTAPDGWVTQVASSSEDTDPPAPEDSAVE